VPETRVLGTDGGTDPRSAAGWAAMKQGTPGGSLALGDRFRRRGRRQLIHAATRLPVIAVRGTRTQTV